VNVDEEKRFAAACEDGTLCDPQYCPYMRGETSRLGACEGDYCEEAWKEFCEQNERDDP
jgi:hypothetical protein